MDKFGLHMNFILIKQVLGIVFILKIQFLIQFLNFSYSLDCASISREDKGKTIKLQQTQTALA
jgi:hypothetical protein